jgi:hypothetical protein
MPLVNTPVRWSDGSRQAQHAHAGVVIMKNFALRRLPDQFFEGRPDHFRSFRYGLPLRRGRQRNAQILFQLRQPVKREAAAILELCDHRRRALIVLLRPHLVRFRRAKYITTGVAAQALAAVHGRCQRRLSHDPH